MSKGARLSIIILFILVLLSLGLNGWLLWQWWSFQQEVDQTVRDVQPALHEALSQAIADLETFQNSPVEFEFEIQQDFPIEMEIPVDETVEIPIQTTVPINQEIETTILLDPFQSGLAIPTDVVVPVDLEVPLDLNVAVKLDESFPISTTIPIDVTVPLSIDVQETELAPYLERLQAGLVSLDQMIADLE